MAIDVGRTYDVSADGQRFLMVKNDPAESEAARIVVVTDWLTEVEARLSGQ